MSQDTHGAAAGAERDHAADPVVVIGAGPAGLTAAYRLVARREPVVVLEAEDVVGGLSRTVERDGWRFDLGGHRFFTRVPEVFALWQEILDDQRFVVRPRMSRIYYRGGLFDYPLRAGNALRRLGPVEALRCVGSYLWVRVRPPKDQSHFEGWVTARFGSRLYRIFFKTYTEKVWGVPATSITSDWAEQRIKNLSLPSAVLNALLPRRGSTQITTLIEQFHYPLLGPGQMWEQARDDVRAGGGAIVTDAPVTRLERVGNRVEAVVSTVDGHEQRHPCSSVISSMPLSHLVLAMDPPAPPEVQESARALGYRDFLTVALVVPEAHSFPDNWVYVHSPEVRLGRVQNFGSWSPHMVKPGRTCLGLEYFVNEGDDLWTMADDDLVAFATRELVSIGLADEGSIQAGYVVRVPKAYPVYDAEFQGHVDTIRAWLEEAAVNVAPVGRNGMHRYNNQDHSMLTAMLAVENLHGGEHDIWAVNVDEGYHEEGVAPDTSGSSGAVGSGGGRMAPVTPAPARPASEVVSRS